jgi:3D (Asp-Asp-Asp) domain-containing protein
LRLRTLYEEGDVSALEIVLGSKTLDDALTRLDSLDRIAALDETVLDQVKTAKRQLASSSTALAQRAVRLVAAVQEAAATAETLARARAERQAFIARLATQQRLNESEIGRVEEQARAAQARAQAFAVAAPAATAVSAAAVSPATAAASISSPRGAHTITVTVTGYALAGRTATGLPAGWGVAAVDPGLIPLGARLSIPGYGEAVAADTGGAIAGATIDLWFPNEAQARAWGRRTLTVAIR